MKWIDNMPEDKAKEMLYRLVQMGPSFYDEDILTDEARELIEQWPYEFGELALLDYVFRGWKFGDDLVKQAPNRKIWYVRTGGLSRNEELLYALKKSVLLPIKFHVIDLDSGQFIIIHKDESEKYYELCKKLVQMALDGRPENTH